MSQELRFYIRQKAVAANKHKPSVKTGPYCLETADINV